MPRYLVERDLPDGLDLLLARKSVESIISSYAENGVTWLCSFVSDGRQRTYCLYEAAGPEAIRKAARRIELPVGVIRRISVFDPHAFHIRPGNDT